MERRVTLPDNILLNVLYTGNKPFLAACVLARPVTGKYKRRAY
jgi:hypothetical protein